MIKGKYQIEFRNILILLVIISFCSSCSGPVDLEGYWVAKIEMQGKTLPFNFELKSQEGGYKAVFMNSEERLEIENVQVKSDSLIIEMDIFDTFLKAKIEGDRLIGVYDRAYREDYILPFSAKKGKKRFTSEHIKTSVDGKYKVTFSQGPEEWYAIGIFENNESSLTGTFLTETGDYRYLEGVETEDSILLSSFDGEHLFLFAAEKIGDSLSGGFWSGSHYYEPWVAEINSEFSLNDDDSLTQFIDENEVFSFSFRNEFGDTVSLSEFIGTPIIVQIMGTWCPNCMDETRFLSEWYNQKEEEIEIIGLAFERKTEFNYAANRIKTLKKKLNVQYPILFAGSSEKDLASEALPMLSEILAFPTTVYLNKNHEIITVKTGFSGPGTGIYFEEFKEDFQEIIEEMSD